VPKMKTHKGTAKRFKKTARGKIARRHAFVSHLLTKKRRKRKRKLRQSTLVGKADRKRFLRLLG